ncbi:CaiB/BaiF CoA transferase family protein [Streptomyces sp. NPDC059866]|uniref:CaiB/BaiF CoA transferase family protein n=1 Tax=Streptomyces sp. NPDC059866 TaxID=3346978 RepID=UPI00365256FE
MGPLSGLKVVEIGAQGPGPFCATVLADLGARVVRVDRPSDVGQPFHDVALRRSRRSVAVDLKSPEGASVVLRLVEDADVLIEGFRPGVMERLGLGPEECHARNPRLVYGRMTGWGQDGPWAQVAGHDINYTALSGALAAIGRPGGGPVVPLNLVADFGGGGMLLAVGVLAALLARGTTGRGQVVDAAMIDGAAQLMGIFYGMRQQGLWSVGPGTNWLDGGADFYDTYETADGRYIALGAIEHPFRHALYATLGLDADALMQDVRVDTWPERKKLVADAVRRRTRDEWCELFEGVDACFAPVLTVDEAPHHPQYAQRGSFVESDGVLQPAPAPRFQDTPCAPPTRAARPGEDSQAVLTEAGYSADDVEALLTAGVVATAVPAPAGRD